MFECRPTSLMSRVRQTGGLPGSALAQPAVRSLDSILSLSLQLGCSPDHQAPSSVAVQKGELLLLLQRSSGRPDTVHYRSFAAYAVAFSPFFPNKLAVAGSANFGLVGNGRLSVLGNGPQAMGVEKV